MRHLRALIAGIGILACATAAHGADAPDCASGSRCTWVKGGADPLEAVAARGGETVRFIGGYALYPHDGVMFEIGRDGDAVTATIHDVDRPQNKIIIPASLALWQRIVALRARAVAREAVTQRRNKAADAASGETVVCTDGAGLDVDSVLAGKIEHLAWSDCRDPMVNRLLARLPKIFYPLVPACLHVRRHDRSLCASLRGDWAIATRYAGEAVSFTGDALCRPMRGFDPAAYVAPGAVLRIAGEPDTPPGSAGLLQGVCAGALGLLFEAETVTGADGRLIVAGTTIRFGETLPNGLSRQVAAPSTQILRIDHGKLRIESWVVEKFAP